MKSFLRELVIYQLVAVAMTLIGNPISEFLGNLPVYLILTNCIAWSIRTVFLLASIRLDFLQWRRRWQAIFILPAVATGCFVGALVASQIFKVAFGHDIGGPLLLGIFRSSLPGAVIVTILILSYYSFRERLETQTVERERLKRLQARAELAALQSKLNPHFLFNTLNTMVNLVRKEPDKVEEMILRLADVYRRVLKLPSNERIDLSEEFDMARQYLAIEQVRLGDRLRYEVQLPDDLREISVPPLLIQPLVENAVIHGIMPSPRGGSLSLSARKHSDRIQVTVEDDGVGMSLGNAGSRAKNEDDGHSAQGGVGFGLHSTRERLRLAYGGKGRMTIESRLGRGTKVSLELPIGY